MGLMALFYFCCLGIMAFFFFSKALGGVRMERRQFPAERMEGNGWDRKDSFFRFFFATQQAAA